MSGWRSRWTGRRVFVTGGNGFLGSHLVRLLVDAGAKVTCLISEDRPLSRFYLDGTIGQVECVQGSIDDFELLCAEMCGNEALFHLAAQPIIGEAKRDPLPMWESNVRGTYNVLEAARRNDELQSIVVVTSDKVYGESARLPYHETDRLKGISPYDASKVCADVLAQSYAHSFGMPIGIARLANLYGPGDSQWSRIVPGTIRSLLSKERPIIRSDGHMRRDYLYVEDGAKALLVLSNALSAGKSHGEAFNFGTGVPISVIDIVRAITKRAGSDINPIIENTAKGEISSQYLDCGKAKQFLGWEPRVSLPVGIDCTWNWYEHALRAK